MYQTGKQCKSLKSNITQLLLTKLFRRKRFKRFFEKDDEPLQLVGSTLGTPNTDGAAPATKPPRTPKAKASAAVSVEDGDSSPKAKSSGRKRKTADAFEEESKDGADEDNLDDAQPTEESLKKKSKTTKSTAPKTPKSPKTPRKLTTPKVAQTPKSTKAPKVSKSTQQESDTTGADERQPAITQDGRIGSPEIQAKTDATIKEIEGKGEVAVGEPEGQAIHDGFEKSATSAEDD